jgi:hypothetical protein
VLQIVALPELRVVWSARRSGQFPEVLIDAPDDELSQETVKSDEIIVEVLCYGMGFNQVGGVGRQVPRGESKPKSVSSLGSREIQYP